jgi:hypothetical protein
MRWSPLKLSTWKFDFLARAKLSKATVSTLARELLGCRHILVTHLSPTHGMTGRSLSDGEIPQSGAGARSAREQLSFIAHDETHSRC